MSIRRLANIRRLQEAIDTLYDNTLDNEAAENIEINENTAVKHVLSEEGESNLTILNYHENLFSYKTCPILNTDFSDNQLIIELPCKHIFDKDSIENWLKNEKAECPVCRFKLPSKEKSCINGEEIQSNHPDPESYHPESNYLDSNNSNSIIDNIDIIDNSTVADVNYINSAAIDLAYESDIAILREAFNLVVENAENDFINFNSTTD